MGERFVTYLHSRDYPDEYSFEQLSAYPNQYPFLICRLDWVACCLGFGKPLGGKQLFVYGVPQDQKGLLFHLLSPALRVLFITKETINRLGEIALSGRQTFDICILDRDKIRKDPTWVYQLQGLPPIITMATGLDSIADLCCGQSPFRWRYLRLPFSASPMPALDEGRLIATQWGCLRRRVCYSPFSFLNPIPRDVSFDYTDIRGHFFPSDGEPDHRSDLQMDRYMELALNEGENLLMGFEDINGLFYTSGGQCLSAKAIRVRRLIGGETYGRSGFFLSLPRDWRSYTERNEEELPFLSILDFSIIPLAKPRNRQIISKGLVMSFDPPEPEMFSSQLELMANPKKFHFSSCLLWRSPDPNLMDYSVWPLELSSDGFQPGEGKLVYIRGLVDTGLPLVLKLDQDQERTERLRSRSEALFSAVQERAQSGRSLYSPLRQHG